MSDQGQVKWFNNESGWGFISCDNSDDILVRHDQIHGNGFKTLYVGDLVEFNIEQGTNGPFAVNVKVVSQRDAGNQRHVS